MQPNNQIKEKEFFYFFKGGIILKGIHAAIEIIGGFLTLFITQDFFMQSVFRITNEELIEDPRDFIANYLLQTAQHFSVNSQHFIALYLLVHGIIKGILVIALLKNKLWAYPVSLIIFSLFALYQIVRFTSTHSIWLLVFTLFDIIVIWLVWKEYRVVRLKSE